MEMWALLAVNRDWEKGGMGRIRPLVHQEEEMTLR